MRTEKIQMLSVNLVLSILKNVKERFSVPEVALFESQPMSKAEVRRGLRELEVSRFVSREGGEVKVPTFQKVQLAVLAVRLGASLDHVCRYLSWQEFEKITQLALEELGYETVLHQRFRSERRSCEIDIVGVLGEIIIAVDCKHWKRSLTGSTAERVAKAQLQRVEITRLERNLSKIEKALGRSLKRDLTVIPVIVTLVENPCSIACGVPVVPVLRFSSFLNEFLGYLDVLSTVTV